MTRQKISYLIFRTRENTGTKVVFDQVLALRKRGHKVDVYTLFGTSASWYPKGMSTRSIVRYPFFNKPDVLVATFWPTAYLALILPASKKFYLVMGFEEAFHTVRIVKLFAKLSYKLPLMKITVSKYLKERITHYTQKANHIAVIKTYIPISIFPKKKIRKNSESVIRILSVVSWYNKVKGIDLLERVVRQLKKSSNNYAFVLVSRERVPYAPIFDNFYSNPDKETLQRLYEKADILLATSRNEGFYIPGIEAMANGCVFVSTDSGGISEYAEDGKNALIMKKLSDLWEKSTLVALLGSAVWRTRLISNGYKTANQYRSYTLNEYGKDVEKILLGGSG